MYFYSYIGEKLENAVEDKLITDVEAEIISIILRILDKMKIEEY